jgi:hypothetical protein
MKLEDKQKVVVQVYPGRQYGLMIGSYEGLIGLMLDDGNYIDVLLERVRIVSVEVEDGEDNV